MNQNLYIVNIDSNNNHIYSDKNTSNLLNVLDEKSNQLDFNHSTIKLFQHQKTLLYQIDKMERNVELEDLNDIIKDIQSNIGIICDMVGSGKTYSILSQIFRKIKVEHFKYKLITSKPLIYNRISKNFHMALMSKSTQYRVLGVNFIIVPNIVYNQWISYLKQFLTDYPNINVKYIFGKKSFANDIEKELKELYDEKYQIVLASSNYWNLYYKKYLSNINNDIDNILFSRMIIDEIDTIDIGKRTDISLLPCSFYWFISSNYENLFYPNGKRRTYLNSINDINNSNKMNNYENIKGFLHINYLKNFFSTFDKDKFSKIFLYNDPNWIKKSIQIPNILNLEYYATDILEDHIENLIKYGGCEKIVNYLNSNDWEGLSNYTNCNVKNTKDLYEYLTNELEIQIENRKNELEYRKKIIVSNNNQRELQENQNKIHKIEDQIKSFEIRKETLKNNIENVNNEECSICVSELNNPVFVRCCFHHFCSECLMNYFISNKNKHTDLSNCPLCRQEIKKDMMFFVNDNFEKKGIFVYENKNKFEILYEIIKQKKINTRILIFIDKISLYEKFITEFKQKDIPFNIFNGSIYKINNIIEKYNSGEIPILLLNASSYGTGLNLQNTTDIILFNRMDRCLESQIIGRAQRIGRNTQLKIHYIMYRNEKNLDKYYFDNGLYSIDENENIEEDQNL